MLQFNYKAWWERTRDGFSWSELFARSSTSFNWAQKEKPQFSHLRFHQFYFKTFNWAQKERPQFSHLRLAQLCWALEQRLDRRLHCFLLRQEWKILINTRKCLFYRLNSGKLAPKQNFVSAGKSGLTAGCLSVHSFSVDSWSSNWSIKQRIL